MATCPHCGKIGSTAKSIVAGRPVRCPGCSRSFRVGDDARDKPQTEPAPVASPPPWVALEQSVWKPIQQTASESTSEPATSGLASIKLTDERLLTARRTTAPESRQSRQRRHTKFLGGLACVVLAAIAAIVYLVAINLSTGRSFSKSSFADRSAYLSRVNPEIGLAAIETDRFVDGDDAGMATQKLCKLLKRISGVYKENQVEIGNIVIVSLQRLKVEGITVSPIEYLEGSLAWAPPEVFSGKELPEFIWYSNAYHKKRLTKNLDHNDTIEALRSGFDDIIFRDK